MHCSLPIDVKSNLYLSRENLYKSDPNLEKDTALPGQGCIKVSILGRVVFSFLATSNSLSPASQSFWNLCKRGLIDAPIRFLPRSNWKTFKGVQSFTKSIENIMNRNVDKILHIMQLNVMHATGGKIVTIQVRCYIAPPAAATFCRNSVKRTIVLHSICISCTPRSECIQQGWWGGL